MRLDWPTETVLPDDDLSLWQQASSNCVLDFHGDPLKARLVADIYTAHGLRHAADLAGD